MRLSDEDQDLSLVRQNNARPVRYSGQTVLELFAKAARENPDAAAVAGGDLTQSYRDLDNESAKFAAQLKVGGFGPGSRVALVFANGDHEYPSVLLGVLKSGACAVPLSAGIPADLLRSLLEEAAPDLAVCGRRLPQNLAGAMDALGDAPVADPKGYFLKGGTSGVMGFSKLSVHFVKRERDRVAIDPDSPAYVVYSSGRLLGQSGEPARAAAEPAGGTDWTGGTDGAATGSGGAVIPVPGGGWIPGSGDGGPAGTGGLFGTADADLFGAPDAGGLPGAAGVPGASGAAAPRSACGLRGVVVSHRALFNQLSWAGDFLDIVPGDVHCVFSTPASDVSLMEMLVPLTRGAAVLPLPLPAGAGGGDALWETVHINRVTSLSLPLRKLRQYASRYPLYGLKTILTWGRGLSGDNLKDLIRDGSGCRIVNCFGLPECAITSLAEDARPGSFPETMGRPAPNCPSYLLDREMRLVPAGFPGELHCGGVQTASGYDRRPEETARAFIPDPFATISPPEYRAGRLFRTGIMARRRPDGRLDYMGRAGEAPVVRGARVPLHEVERTLLGAAGVLEALVVRREDYSSYFEPYLCAYLTLSGTPRSDAPAIKAYLAERLPAYMVPERVAILQEFPLDAFGRVDVKALPAPPADDAADDGAGQAGRAPAAAAVAPASEDEASHVALPEGTDPFAGAPADLSPAERARIRRSMGDDLALVMPLAPGQSALLTGGGLGTDGPRSAGPMITTVTAHLTGPLDPQLMRHRLGLILGRHDVFRLSLHPRDGGFPVQVWTRRIPAVSEVLAEEDLRYEDARRREALLAALEATHHSAIKDVSRAPLLRASLLRVADDGWELVVSYLRLAFDPVSIAIFLRELWGGPAGAAAPAPGSAGVPGPPVSPGSSGAAGPGGGRDGDAPSYAAFMQRLRDPARREADLSYWRGQLQDLSAPSRLPGRFPQAGGASVMASSISDKALLKLPAGLSAAVTAAAAAEGVPLDAFLMAAWGVLLTRASRGASATFGLSVHGRDGDGEGLMGPCWSLVPVTVKAPAGARFSDVAREAALAAAEGARHASLGLMEIERVSPLKGETVGHFWGMRASMVPDVSTGPRIASFEERPRAFAFPLAVTWSDEPQLEAEFNYDTGYFLPWQIHILSESYLSILASAAADPSATVDRLKLVSDAARRAQLEAEGALARVYEGGTVPGVFSKWAALGPRRPAVSQGGVSASYGELAAVSGTLASALSALGVRPGEGRVGLMMGRSPAYPAALLGVLRSGAAAVPLPLDDEADLLMRLQDARPAAVVVDGPLPPAQLARVLDRAPVTVVLDPRGTRLEAASPGAGTQPGGPSGTDGSDPAGAAGPAGGAGGPSAPAILFGTPAAPEGDGATQGELPPADTGPCLAEPDMPAYVSYARDPDGGGAQVGVVVSHAALMNLTSWTAEFLDLRAEDTQSAFMPFTSEISFLEILAPLACGAKTLVFADDDRRDLGALYRAAVDGGCSSVWLPPGGLKLLASKYPLTPFKILSAAGEGLPLPIRVLEPGGCRISSILGVPECAGAVAGESSAPGGVPQSLGFSAPNCPAYIIDDQGELLPSGFIGELYIGGVQTASGYLNRPDLTDRLFPPDPFAGHSPAPFRSARLFRTGILAVRHPDGRLYKTGRVHRGPAALPRYLAAKTAEAAARIPPPREPETVQAHPGALAVPPPPFPEAERRAADTASPSAITSGQDARAPSPERQGQDAPAPSAGPSVHDAVEPVMLPDADSILDAIIEGVEPPDGVPPAGAPAAGADGDAVIDAFDDIDALDVLPDDADSSDASSAPGVVTDDVIPLEDIAVEEPPQPSAAAPAEVPAPSETPSRPDAQAPSGSPAPSDVRAPSGASAPAETPEPSAASGADGAPSDGADDILPLEDLFAEAVEFPPAAAAPSPAASGREAPSEGADDLLPLEDLFVEEDGAGPVPDALAIPSSPPAAAGLRAAPDGGAARAVPPVSFSEPDAEDLDADLMPLEDVTVEDGPPQPASPVREPSAAAPPEPSVPASPDAGAPPEPSVPASPDAAVPPEPSVHAAPDAGSPPEPSVHASPDAGAPPEPSVPASPDAGAPPEPSVPASPDAGSPPEPSVPASPDAAAPPEPSVPASQDAGAPPEPSVPASQDDASSEPAVLPSRDAGAPPEPSEFASPDAGAPPEPDVTASPAPGVSPKPDAAPASGTDVPAPAASAADDAGIFELDDLPLEEVVLDDDLTRPDAFDDADSLVPVEEIDVADDLYDLPVQEEAGASPVEDAYEIDLSELDDAEPLTEPVKAGASISSGHAPGYLGKPSASPLAPASQPAPATRAPAAPVPDAWGAAPAGLTDADRRRIGELFPGGIRKVLPLTPFQTGLLSSPGGMEGAVCQLRAKFSPEAAAGIAGGAAGVLESLLASQPELSASYVYEGISRPVRVWPVRGPGAAGVLGEMDLSAEPAAAAEKKARGVMKAQAEALSLPERPGKIAADCLSLPGGGTELVLSVHMGAADRSQALAILVGIVSGEAPWLPAPPDAPASMAARAEMDSQWEELLRDAGEPTELPRRVARCPDKEAGSRRAVPVRFKESEHDEFLAAAARMGVDLADFVTGAWLAFVSRLTGNRCPQCALLGPAPEGGAGGFMRPFPLPLGPDASLEASARAAAARTRSTGRLGHLSYPEILRLSGWGRAAADHVISPPPVIPGGGLPPAVVSLSETPPRGLDSFPLSLFWKSAGGLELTIGYSLASFEPWQAEVLAQGYEIFLRAMKDSPGALADEVELLPPEKRKALAAAAAGARELPPGSFADMFAAAAAADPVAAAVRSPGGAVSYGALASASASLAASLAAAGAGPGKRVAVLASPTPGYCAALVAVMRAGAAAVPVADGPGMPAALALAAPCCAVAPAGASAFRAALAPGVPVLDPDAPPVPGAPPVPSAPSAPPDPARGGSHALVLARPAPGGPDGAGAGWALVPVSHEALKNLALSRAKDTGASPEDVFSVLSDPSGPAGLAEILTPLSMGASCAMPGAGQAGGRFAAASVASLVAGSGVTVLTLPEAAALSYAASRPLDGLKALCALGSRSLGGSSLPPDAVRQMLKGSGECRIVYAWGPDEAMGAALCEPAHPGRLPGTLGAPVPNVPVYVLGRDGEPVPSGYPGRLAAGGASVPAAPARGGPDAADAPGRLVPEPAAVPGGASPGWLVMTDIVARRRPDGRFDCLGLCGPGTAPSLACRLRSAERRLLESPGVLDARVWLAAGKASAAVVMYPALGGGERAALEKALQRRLAPELPAGTGPARVTALAEFPLDRAGGVDLARLAPPPGPAPQAARPVQPQGKSGDPAGAGAGTGSDGPGTRSYDPCRYGEPSARPGAGSGTFDPKAYGKSGGPSGHGRDGRGDRPDCAVPGCPDDEDVARGRRDPPDGDVRTRPGVADGLGDQLCGGVRSRLGDADRRGDPPDGEAGASVRGTHPDGAVPDGEPPCPGDPATCAAAAAGTCIQPAHAAGSRQPRRRPPSFGAGKTRPDDLAGRARVPAAGRAGALLRTPRGTRGRGAASGQSGHGPRDGKPAGGDAEISGCAFDPLRYGKSGDPPPGALGALLAACAQAMNMPSELLDPDLGFEEQGGDSLSAFFASQQLRAGGWALAGSDLLAALSLREAAEDAGPAGGGPPSAGGQAGASPGDARPRAARGAEPAPALGDDPSMPFAAGSRAQRFQAKELEDEARVAEALAPGTVHFVSPLTPAMEAVAASWERGGARYAQRLLEIPVDADPFALGARLELLGARHEILRTSVVTEGVARSRLAVRSDLELPLTYTSLIGFSSADRDERVREFRRAVPRPDPARDPLFRADVFQAEPARALVLVSYLEELLDQHSLCSLAHELMALRPPTGAPRPMSEFLALLEGRERTSDREFWEGALKGLRSVSSLFVPAAGEPDPGLETPVSFEIDEQVYRRLKTLVRISHVPLQTLVECAFAATLSMFNGEKVQLYARRAPVREMLSSRLQNTMGCLLSLAPARCELTGQKTFLECAASLDRFHSDAAPHAYAPLWEIRGAAGGLDMGDIVFFAEEETRFTQGSLKIREIPLPRPRRSEADLTFHLEWSERQARVTVHASPGRFRRSMILDFRDGFLGVVAALAASPRNRLSDVTLLSGTLRERALDAARGRPSETGRGGGDRAAREAGDADGGFGPEAADGGFGPEAGDAEFGHEAGDVQRRHPSGDGSGDAWEGRAAGGFGESPGEGRGPGAEFGGRAGFGSGFRAGTDGGGNGGAASGSGGRSGFGRGSRGSRWAPGVQNRPAQDTGAGRELRRGGAGAAGPPDEPGPPDPSDPPDPGDLSPAADPAAPAMEHGGRAWSFADVARAVSEGARFLSDKAASSGMGALGGLGTGAPPSSPALGMRLAILFPYGPHLALAALSAVRAGCAAVPLDPMLPEGRHRFVLGDSAADAVLSSSELLPYAEDLAKSSAAERGLSAQLRAPVWDFESVLAHALGPGTPAGDPRGDAAEGSGGSGAGEGKGAASAWLARARGAGQAQGRGHAGEGRHGALPDTAESAAARGAAPSPGDPGRLAAVLYPTRPGPGNEWSREDTERGGTALTARGLSERMRASREAFGIGPGSRVMAVPGTPSERLFADIVPALRAGAAVAGLAAPPPGRGRDSYPGADELGTFLRDRAVTFAWLPAVAAKKLLGRSDLGSLATLAMSGPTSGTAYPGWDGLRVVYAYGAPGYPALWRECADGPSAPRGRPASGTEAYVADRNGRIMPPGAPGGIALCGEAVGRPPGERSQGSIFMASPLGRGAMDLMRAPDSGWLDEDGCVNVLSGTDACPLPAVRGRAFSPEAVELRLFSPSTLKNMHAGIWAGEGVPEIALWLKASFREEDEGEKSREMAKLRRTLASSLPAWLVPTRLALVSRIPLENGVPVPARLPAPDLGPLSSERALEGDPVYLEACQAVASAWRAFSGADPEPGRTLASCGLDGDIAYLMAKNLRARGFPAEGADFRAFPTPEAVAAEMARRVGAAFGPVAEEAGPADDGAVPGRLEGAYEDLGEIALAGDGEGEGFEASSGIRAVGVGVAGTESGSAVAGGASGPDASVPPDSGSAGIDGGYASPASGSLAGMADASSGAASPVADGATDAATPVADGATDAASPVADVATDAASPVAGETPGAPSGGVQAASAAGDSISLALPGILDAVAGAALSAVAASGQAAASADGAPEAAGAVPDVGSGAGGETAAGTDGSSVSVVAEAPASGQRSPDDDVSAARSADAVKADADGSESPSHAGAAKADADGRDAVSGTAKGTAAGRDDAAGADAAKADADGREDAAAPSASEPEDVTGIVAVADDSGCEEDVVDISRVVPADESNDLPPDISITPLDEPEDIVAFDFGGIVRDDSPKPTGSSVSGGQSPESSEAAKSDGLSLKASDAAKDGDGAALSSGAVPAGGLSLKAQDVAKDGAGAEKEPEATSADGRSAKAPDALNAPDAATADGLSAKAGGEAGKAAKAPDEPEKVPDVPAGGIARSLFDVFDSVATSFSSASGKTAKKSSAAPVDAGGTAASSASAPDISGEKISDVSGDAGSVPSETSGPPHHADAQASAVAGGAAGTSGKSEPPALPVSADSPKAPDTAESVAAPAASFGTAEVSGAPGETPSSPPPETDASIPPAAAALTQPDAAGDTEPHIDSCGPPSAEETPPAPETPADAPHLPDLSSSAGPAPSAPQAPGQPPSVEAVPAAQAPSARQLPSADASPLPPSSPPSGTGPRAPVFSPPAPAHDLPVFTGGFQIPAKVLAPATFDPALPEKPAAYGQGPEPSAGRPAATLQARPAAPAVTPVPAVPVPEAAAPSAPSHAAARPPDVPLPSAVPSAPAVPAAPSPAGPAVPAAASGPAVPAAASGPAEPAAASGPAVPAAATGPAVPAAASGPAVPAAASGPAEPAAASGPAVPAAAYGPAVPAAASGPAVPAAASGPAVPAAASGPVSPAGSVDDAGAGQPSLSASEPAQPADGAVPPAPGAATQEELRAARTERARARALSALSDYVDVSKVEELVELVPFQQALAAQAATQAGPMGLVGLRSWTLEAPLSPDALEAAFADIVRETPKLRSVFTPAPCVMRAVLSEIPRAFSASDLKPLGKGAPEAAREAAVQVALSLWGGAGAPALHRGPLMRLMCFRLDEGVYRMTLVYALPALSPPEATMLLEAVASRAAAGRGTFVPFPDPPLPPPDPEADRPPKELHPAFQRLKGLVPAKVPVTPVGLGFAGDWDTVRNSLSGWTGSPFPLKADFGREDAQESPLLEVELAIDGKTEQAIYRAARAHGTGVKAFLASAWLMYLSVYFDRAQAGTGYLDGDPGPAGSENRRGDDDSDGFAAGEAVASRRPRSPAAPAPGAGQLAPAADGQAAPRPRCAGRGPVEGVPVMMPLVVEFPDDATVSWAVRACGERVAALSRASMGERFPGWGKVMKALNLSGTAQSRFTSAVVFDQCGPAPSAEGFRTRAWDGTLYPGPSLTLHVETSPPPGLRTAGRQPGIRGRVAADRSLLGADLAHAVRTGFLSVLAQAAESPSRRLADLTLLASGDMARIRKLGRGAEIPPRPRESLGFMIRRRLEELGGAPALSSQDGRLDGRGLVARVREVSEFSGGMGADLLGAVIMPMGADFVTAALSLVMSGAAVAPMDPEWIAQRLRNSLRDADPDLVMLTAETNPLAADHPAPRLVFREGGRLTPLPGLRPARPPLPEGTGAVLYSGGSGPSLGAVLAHAALSARARQMRDAWKISQQDKVALLTGSSAPEALPAACAALLAGAELCLPPSWARDSAQAFLDYARREGITVAFVPALLSRGIQSAEAPRTLRACVAVGGRVSFYRPQPYAFWADWGPRETLGAGLRRRLERQETVHPLGWPSPGAETFVISRSGTVRPLGLAGEIAVGGAYVARGYLNRPEESARRFMEDARAGGGEPRLVFRTGLRGEADQDGNVYPKGRTGEILNFLGLEPELQEIERAVKFYPGVFDARVMPFSDAKGLLFTECYVVRRGASAAATAMRRPKAPAPPPVRTIPALTGPFGLGDETFDLLDMPDIADDAAALAPGPGPARGPADGLPGKDGGPGPGDPAGAAAQGAPDGRGRPGKGGGPAAGPSGQGSGGAGTGGGPGGPGGPGRSGKDGGPVRGGNGSAVPGGPGGPGTGGQASSGAAGGPGGPPGPQGPVADDDALFTRKLEAHLRAVLPPAMAPRNVTCIPAFPLTEAGRMDFVRLPKPWREGIFTASDVTPRTLGEYFVLKELALAFTHREVGLEERFSDLGGDSLAAAEFSWALRERLGMAPPPREILNSFTMKDVARTLEGMLAEKGGGLVTLRRGRGPALVLAPAAASGVLPFRGIWEALPAGVPVLAMSPYEDFHRSHRGAREAELMGLWAESCAGTLASALPRGGFVMLASGFKGALAWEAARRLKESHGIGARALVFLDAAAPPPEGGPFPHPSPQEMKRALDALYYYEGSRPERREASEEALLFELRAWWGTPLMPSSAPVLSVRSSDGIPEGHLPLPWVHAPLKALAQGGYSELAVEGDSPSLFAGEGAAVVARALEGVLG
ncbi:MAG: AMP-binding protein [Deltaproteobacteria bacterium]|nr:AMP-binding protein [Deltaproteobacteria bacterium]